MLLVAVSLCALAGDLPALRLDVLEGRVRVAHEQGTASLPVGAVDWVHGPSGYLESSTLARHWRSTSAFCRKNPSLSKAAVVAGEAAVATEVAAVAALATLASLATALADATGADPFVALRAVADPVAAVAGRAARAVLALTAAAVAVAAGALVIHPLGIALGDGPLLVATLIDGLALVDVAVAIDVVSLVGVRTVEVGQEQPVDD